MMLHAGPQDTLRSYPNSGSDHVCLEAVIYNSVTEEQVNKLFDLIPGMDRCVYDMNTGIA